MKIREHVWVIDRCVMCGAFSWAKIRAAVVLAGRTDPGPTDDRQCVEREDHQHDLRPEPMLRAIAVESWDDINKRIAELYAARTEAMNTTEDTCQ